MLRHLSRHRSPAPSPNRHIGPWGSGRTGLICWCCRKSPSILAVYGYGFSNCSLTGALFSSSLQKPAGPPAPLKLPSSWWWWCPYYWWFCLKDTSISTTSFDQILPSLRGRARQDVHVEIEVPLGMFLPTGIL